MPDISEAKKFYLYQGTKDYHLETLRKNEIWFSRPSQFNDPFELGFVLDGLEMALADRENMSLKNALEAGLRLLQASMSGDHWLLSRDVIDFLGREDTQAVLDPLVNPVDSQRVAPIYFPFFELLAELKRKIQTTLEKRGIACMSRRSDSVLMWAHYADSHRGFCVELVEDCDDIFGYSDLNLEQVRYSNVRPTVHLNELLFGLKEPIRKIFATKSSDWSYEEEWRFITDEEVPEKGMGKSVRHFARIDRVIIGAKASDDAKASLREISAKLGVACTEAKLSDSEFRVVV